jgi:hypothetical protein
MNKALGSWLVPNWSKSPNPNIHLMTYLESLMSQGLYFNFSFNPQTTLWITHSKCPYLFILGLELSPFWWWVFFLFCFVFLR